MIGYGTYALTQVISYDSIFYSQKTLSYFNPTSIQNFLLLFVRNKEPCSNCALITSDFIPTKIIQSNWLVMMNNLIYLYPLKTDFQICNCSKITNTKVGCLAFLWKGSKRTKWFKHFRKMVQWLPNNIRFYFY